MSTALQMEGESTRCIEGSVNPEIATTSLGPDRLSFRASWCTARNRHVFDKRLSYLSRPSLPVLVVFTQRMRFCRVIARVSVNQALRRKIGRSRHRRLEGERVHSRDTPSCSSRQSRAVCLDSSAAFSCARLVVPHERFLWERARCVYGFLELFLFAMHHYTALDSSWPFYTGSSRFRASLREEFRCRRTRCTSRRPAPLTWCPRI